ncbi:hypothetical protein [Aquimarina sp. RZ0]|uniref:hypothetical protein n=1 Tax=Aquimarina sp. RZ0 TaxID=2607730 RepID=UPI0011F2D3B4|nr:hypothetical protein [Aquimarina sp. RZ0]KAA1245504.1 hypothetical protein F0000_11950 [Aquimarina sp. RZ0]
MKLKKVGSILLIVIGALALIIELGSSQKNYYIQSTGIICLMLGLFLVNSGLSSRTAQEEDMYQTDVEEEE